MHRARQHVRAHAQVRSPRRARNHATRHCRAAAPDRRPSNRCGGWCPAARRTGRHRSATHTARTAVRQAAPSLRRRVRRPAHLPAPGCAASARSAGPPHRRLDRDCRCRQRRSSTVIASRRRSNLGMGALNHRDRRVASLLAMTGRIVRHAPLPASGNASRTRCTDRGCAPPARSAPAAPPPACRASPPAKVLQIVLDARLVLRCRRHDLGIQDRARPHPADSGGTACRAAPRCRHSRRRHAASDRDAAAPAPDMRR